MTGQSRDNDDDNCTRLTHLHTVHCTPVLYTTVTTKICKLAQPITRHGFAPIRMDFNFYPSEKCLSNVVTSLEPGHHLEIFSCLSQLTTDVNYRNDTSAVFQE